MMKFGLLLSSIVLGFALGQNEGPPPLPERSDEDPPVQNNPFLIPTSDRQWNEPDADGNYQLDDMVLTEEQFKRHFGTEEEKAALWERQGIQGSFYRWPNKELPFEFSSEITSSNRALINSAVADFNSKLSGCVTIRARQSSDSNYVRVTGQNTGCWSSVGKRGGQQSLNLQPSGCMSSRTIQHEFIHALGMYHMQSRPDRDQYVTIHFDNIQAGKEHNFQLLSDTLTFNTEYNARSFMHYPSWGFAIDSSKPTISSKVSSIPTSALGSSNVLTDTDIKNIQRMYDCDDTTNPDPCENAYGSDSSCDNWASLGYCTQTYVDWMTANCKKSCNLCEDSCENTYSNDASCESWANLGYCTQTYVAWMSANCEKACNTCGQQSCENTYSNDASCESWANLGYCTQTYAAWMSANCEKACDTC